MDYYCEECNIFTKPRSNYKHFKSNTHGEFERCKHKETLTGNPNINDIDIIICSYFIEHNEKFDYYFAKCQFILISNDYQYRSFVTS